jgi:hypothetical protein
MSKAFVISTKWLSNKANKAREYLKPKHAANKLFGATDLYLRYSQNIDRLSLDSMGTEQSLSLDAPLPPALPMSMEFPDLQPVIESEPNKIENTVNTTVMSETNRNLVPGFKYDKAQIEYLDQSNNELENLLNTLEGNGLKVSEVEKLSAGVTRISVEDLIGTRNAKEPELVKVKL